jgi:hypothetical protein
MPIYEYADEGTGVKVELWRPVDERNSPIVLRRTKNIPDRIAIHGLEPSESEAFDNNIVRALYRKEQREGSDFKGCQEFSKKKLKEVWVEHKT